MTLISNRNRFFFATLTYITLFGVFFVPHVVKAQQSISLSVTPTLFEMSANPTQIWQSSVKVINSNPFDLEVFASVVNFAPQGEGGTGKLLPVFEEMTEGSTLAEWIDITDEPIIVKSQESKTVPFIVEVPEDASPGGHFAAILISTEPPRDEVDTLAIRTTQIVTSLFFVRVAGDVNESGTIRSFTTSERLVDIPKIDFELRFENKGNVHLQPRGEIVIYNMWGKERGKIPINHKTHFGNVLPESIRKFQFGWEGESSFTEFGRFRAVASLGYGFDEVKFATSTTYFWVIPLKPILITLATFVGFIIFVLWAIKLYVRRMLQLAGVPVERRIISEEKVKEVEKNDVEIEPYSTISAPVRSGYLDLKGRLEGARAFFEVVRVLISFVLSYKLFFSSIFVIVCALFGLYYFISDATEKTKEFEVTIENPGSALNLSSEEIAYQEIAEKENLPQLGTTGEQAFILDIVNTSGESGTAAEAAAELARHNYFVSSLHSGEGRVDKTSVIVFDTALQEEALNMSKVLGKALLSARTATSTGELPNITIFVGTERTKEK